MNKKDYSAEIHALFEQMRAKILVTSKFSIMRLQILEEREKYVLEKNTRETVKKLKAEIRERKQKTFTLPFANKKYTILPSGKIRTEAL